LKNNQIAFITGASKGIGYSIAKAFALNGTTVACASRNLEDLNKTVEKLKSLGGNAIAVQLDVSNLSNFKSAIDYTIEKFEKIDILVNNAGIVKDNLILRMKEEDWDSVIDVNLKGTFNGVKSVTPYMMKKKYGRIINISSVSGLMGNYGQINYSAAKSGIIGLTKTTARELASRNITVNAVAPGYIQTDMVSDLNDKFKDELLKMIPLGRIGNPDEIAATVLFLSSENAGYITGETISVNGGLYI
tara:strand:- start:53573 stop:54310 length:738 start_codon:yes stop_codon:yes gene_type:complete